MEKGIARYLFELGQLKRVRRSGWWVAGVDQPESVADHSFRCAAIAYLLAELEGANPERAAAIALFHDTGETRVNDQHRVGKTYVAWSGAEEKVVEDQLQRLPQGLREKIGALYSEGAAKDSPEARIAKDADRLECLIQAREYEDRGHHATREWIDNALAALETESAKKIAEECSSANPVDWHLED